MPREASSSPKLALAARELSTLFFKVRRMLGIEDSLGVLTHLRASCAAVAVAAAAVGAETERNSGRSTTARTKMKLPTAMSMAALHRWSVECLEDNLAYPCSGIQCQSRRYLEPLSQ
jgi:hypothetical protein